MSERDLAGKVMLVTGPNTGIGKVTAEVLARRGARVLLAGRSAEKTRPVLEGIRAAGGEADFVALDLADLASVRAAAQAVLARAEPLNVLLNNAGLAGSGATAQGFEVDFGTNHLGHFLLTALLLPRLRASAPARIVNVASVAHFDCRGIDWDAVRRPTRTLTGLREYQVSKLCNVLFTRSLAAGKAGAGVTSYALHPGVVASDAWRRIPWPVRPLLTRNMLSVEDGALTSLHCATSPGAAAEDGLYYDRCKPKAPSALAQDPALAEELWTRSEGWVAAFR